MDRNDYEMTKSVKPGGKPIKMQKELAESALNILELRHNSVL